MVAPLNYDELVADDPSEQKFQDDQEYEQDIDLDRQAARQGSAQQTGSMLQRAKQRELALNVLKVKSQHVAATQGESRAIFNQIGSPAVALDVADDIRGSTARVAAANQNTLFPMKTTELLRPGEEETLKAAREQEFRQTFLQRIAEGDQSGETSPNTSLRDLYDQKDFPLGQMPPEILNMLTPSMKRKVLRGEALTPEERSILKSLTRDFRDDLLKKVGWSSTPMAPPVKPDAKFVVDDDEELI